MSSDWEFAGMTEVLPQRQRLDFRLSIPLHISFDPIFSGTSRWGVAPPLTPAGRAQAAAAAAAAATTAAAAVAHKKRGGAASRQKHGAGHHHHSDGADGEGGGASASAGGGGAAEHDASRARSADVAELLRCGFRCQWSVKIDLLSASSPAVYQRKDLLNQQMLYSFECTISDLLKHQASRRVVVVFIGWAVFVVCLG